MAIFGFHLHDRSQVNLSTMNTDNDNKFSQDVRKMISRINALEARVDELVKNHKPCKCASVPPPQVQQPSSSRSLFGTGK